MFTKSHIVTDIERVRETLFNEIVPNFLPVWRGFKEKKPWTFTEAPFGGWAVLSNDGSYESGWTPTYPTEEQGRADIIHAKPTEACTGTIRHLIQQIIRLDAKPYRARITITPPKQSLIWHQDTGWRGVNVRWHLPIMTNQQCYFETEQGRFHMPADGTSWLFDTSNMHRFVNDSNEPRIHLLAGIQFPDNMV